MGPVSRSGSYAGSKYLSILEERNTGGGGGKSGDELGGSTLARLVGGDRGRDSVCFVVDLGPVDLEVIDSDWIVGDLERRRGDRESW